MQRHTRWKVAVALLTGLGYCGTAGADPGNTETEDPFHGGFPDGEYATGLRLPAPTLGYLKKGGKQRIGGLAPRAAILDPVLTTQFSHDVTTATVATPTKNLATNTRFSFSYIPAGGADHFGEPCLTTPEEAKAAFAAAGDIWANYIQTTVPITIEVC